MRLEQLFCIAYSVLIGLGVLAAPLLQAYINPQTF